MNDSRSSEPLHAYDIFVSYSREDRRKVRRLVDALVLERGWTIWWDIQVRAGEPFDRRIQDILSVVRCVLVVWTPTAVQSKWVRAEAGEGWRREILAPVMIEACEPPLPFRQTHTRDLRGWPGRRLSLEFAGLVSDIQTIIERGPGAQPSLKDMELTRSRARRKRLTKRIGLLTLVCALLGACGILYQQRLARTHDEAFAARLAGEADELRRAVGDTDTNWPLYLLKKERLETLRLSLRIAAEAARRAPTEESESALRRVLMLATAPIVSIPIAEDFSTLAFRSDGMQLAAAGSATGALLVNAKTGETQRRLSGGALAQFSPSGDTLATGGSDAVVRLWDPITGEELRSLPHDHNVTAFVFLSSGKRLVTGDSARIVRLWNTESGQEIWRIEHDGVLGQRLFGGVIPDAVRSVSSSASGALISAVANNVALIIDAASGAVVSRVVGEGRIDQLTFSRDEKLAVTDGDNLLVDVTTGQPRERLVSSIYGPKGYYGDSIHGPKGFNGDGNFIIAVEPVLGHIGWWNIDDRQWVRWGGFFGLHSLAISREQEYAATNCFDGTVLVWNRGYEIARFAMWRGRERSALQFAPGGRLLGTITPSVSIDLWEVWPADPLGAACERLDRNLTRSEWKEYVGDDEPYRETCPHVGGTFAKAAT